MNRNYVYKLDIDVDFCHSVIADSLEEAINEVQNRHPYSDHHFTTVKFAPSSKQLSDAAKQFADDMKNIPLFIASEIYKLVYKMRYGNPKIISINPSLSQILYDEVSGFDIYDYLTDEDCDLKVDKKELDYLMPLYHSSYAYSSSKPEISREEFEDEPFALFDVYCKSFKEKSLLRKGQGEYEIYCIAPVLKEIINEIERLAKADGFDWKVMLNKYDNRGDCRTEFSGLVRWSKNQNDSPMEFASGSKFIVQYADKNKTAETPVGLEIVLYQNK